MNFMENSRQLFESLISAALQEGAFRAEIIDASRIETHRSFRDMCVANTCGMYGRCYMCPPDIGNIDTLMQQIKQYRYALVYQTVTEIADSYDFEGMLEAKKRTYPVAQKLRGIFADMGLTEVLHLGCGGCGVCDVCAKISDEPCRFPGLALPSLEAYGIHVSQLAKTAGMKYTNGQNTVTYFGAVLFSVTENITVTVNGKRISGKRNMYLSEIVGGEKPCGGHGKCGKCKVLAQGSLSELTESELIRLTGDEIAKGVRLACLARVLGDCKVETLSTNRPMQAIAVRDLSMLKIKPAFLHFGVAVDIGTTTLAAQLYDAEGACLSEVSRLNPQQEWGADVISRIESALAGKAPMLARSVSSAVNEMVGVLANIAGIDTKEIDGGVITGNTVMLSLLLKESVAPLSRAPFAAKRLFGETVTADVLELSNLVPETPIYFPSCISAFVGADIVCAILSTDLCNRDTAMLADIGTNGEMAIWHNGRLTVCSTAAGPAFEGVGIAMGMRGAAGAIDRVVLSDQQVSAHVIGEEVPVGICGSGLVDAVACMLAVGAVDESGFLEAGPFVIKDPVSLTQKDIRMVQLAKSAVCAGLMTLVQNEMLIPDTVSALYLAGGFGNYINKESAVKIGLFPRKLAEKVMPVGNAALAGACMLLLNEELRTVAADIAEKAVTLDLSVNRVFSELYMSGMLLEEIC